MLNELQVVFALPYDNPIPGYKNNVVNSMRLWSAKSPQDFDLRFCNLNRHVSEILNFDIFLCVCSVGCS